MIPFALFLLAAGLQTADALQSHRILGKAYYEQGEYTHAVEELEKVLSTEGARGRDYFNAGMAYLQNQQEERALAAFETARQMEPGLVAVDFGLGVLHKRAQRFPLALRELSSVVERDPDDPCTWFNIGAVSFSMQRIGDAEAAFRRVIAMGHARAQNFYVSALFRYASLLARRGAGDEARNYFAEFESLRGVTPNVSLVPTGLENGRYGRIEVLPSPEPPANELVPVGLTSRQELSIPPCEREPALAFGDYDGDGRTDVFVGSSCGASRLFRELDGGKLEDVTAAAGLSSSRNVAGALFVDYENSGAPALYTWGEAGPRLYRNENGSFRDVTGTAGLSSIPPPTSAIALDYDDDGQLDLLLAGSPFPSPGEDSRLELLRNDGDGTFTAADAGLPALASGSRGLAAADFDGDGFVDVFVLAGAVAKVLKNEGGGSFSVLDTAEGDALTGTMPARVEVSDVDRDGWIDVLALDEAGWAVFWNRRGRLEAVPSPIPGLRHRERWLVPLEVAGEGARSYLVRDESGRFLRVSHRGQRRFEATPVELPPNASGLAAALDLDGDAGGSVLVAGRDGRLRVLNTPPPAKSRFVRIVLRGKKTNRQGVGALVELKAGRFYRQEVYPGRPIQLDIGTRERLDVVRITWTHGVIQNLVEVEPGETRIEEDDRQTSSCPFLYMWDGERFRFLTDVVGRAPLGEAAPDGSGVTPNPDDYVRIPPGGMKAKDGRLVFQLTEELRETAYIDAVELVVIDHPREVTLYADERFSSPPFDRFRLYPVRAREEPLEARNDEGDDVLPLVRRADEQYVPISRHRIPGFASEHALILSPPSMGLDGGNSLWLFLRGWVYWPSSSSMKAVSTNPSFVPRPPALQVRDRNGAWVTVVDDVGLPSGIDRTLVVDLSGVFLTEDHLMRIATNYAVRWDEAFFAVSSPSDGLEPVRLDPISADLHYRGFSAVERPGANAPERYHYERLLPAAPWNAARGLYTRYGDVTGLVSGGDPRMVILAPGDEMTLSFDAGALPSPADGVERDYFLHVRGWAKDQDPNTRFSRTVEPLPQMGDGEERMDRDRLVPILVVPLAPPSPLFEPER